MRKSTSIALIIIGIILVAIGWYGIPSVGLPNLPSQALTTSKTDNFNDNSIDTTFWEKFGVATVSEVNQRLEVVLVSTLPSYGGLITKVTYDLDQGYVKAQFGVVSGIPASGGVELEFSPSPNLKVYRVCLRYDKGTVDIDKWAPSYTNIMSIPQALVSGDTVKVEVVGISLKFYYNELLIATETNSGWGTNAKVCLSWASAGKVGVGWVDNFVMGVPPPPDVGNVYIRAWDKTTSTWISCFATLMKPDGSTQTITTLPNSQGYLFSSVPTGVYSVSGSYGSVSPTYDTDSGTLTAGGTLTLTLEFGQGTVPPNGGGDILQQIIKFLNQPTLRYVYLFAGGFCTVAGVGTLVYSIRKPRHFPIF